MNVRELRSMNPSILKVNKTNSFFGNGALARKVKKMNESKLSKTILAFENNEKASRKSQHQISQISSAGKERRTAGAQLPGKGIERN